jgi:phosphomannomutase
MKTSALRKTYPAYFISKNKIELTPQINVDKVLEEVKAKYAQEKINTIDGVKIDFEAEKEWVHLRKSNTEPIIRIYAESQNEKKADALAQRIITDIQNIIK